jgi:ferredoxin
MKIIHELQRCIGCGSCVVVCSEHFEMGEGGKAHLKKSKVNSETGNEELEVKKLDCIDEASDICPVQCIKIVK